MGVVKKREKHEVYQPKAKVLKVRGGVPTRISINGYVYAILPGSYGAIGDRKKKG